MSSKQCFNKLLLYTFYKFAGFIFSSVFIIDDNSGASYISTTWSDQSHTAPSFSFLFILKICMVYSVRNSRICFKWIYNKSQSNVIKLFLLEILRCISIYIFNTWSNRQICTESYMIIPNCYIFPIVWAIQIRSLYLNSHLTNLLLFRAQASQEYDTRDIIYLNSSLLCKYDI